LFKEANKTERLKALGISHSKTEAKPKTIDSDCYYKGSRTSNVDARDDDRGEHKVGCVLTLTKRSPVAHPLITLSHLVLVLIVALTCWDKAYFPIGVS